MGAVASGDGGPAKGGQLQACVHVTMHHGTGCVWGSLPELLISSNVRPRRYGLLLLPHASVFSPQPPPWYFITYPFRALPNGCSIRLYPTAPRPSFLTQPGT